jgi:site-specific DNA-methyltransferase (adenine-specific)
MLHLGDCVEEMKKMPSGKVDMIFADPPYFLSNGGLSIHNGKVVSVNKGDWDKRSNCADIEKFTKDWLNECHRLLKPNGTIWVSGTTHNIFDVQKALSEIGFHLINMVIWHKVDPPPLIYKNKFKFSYEMIIWAGKSKDHFFDYQAMFNDAKEEMHDVWNLPAVQMAEKTFGYHPTQKPIALLNRIVLSSTKPGDIVLDPFMGSGTTGVAAKTSGRKFVGIEKESTYFAIAKSRIASLENSVTISSRGSNNANAFGLLKN